MLPLERKLKAPFSRGSFAEIGARLLAITGEAACPKFDAPLVAFDRFMMNVFNDGFAPKCCRSRPPSLMAGYRCFSIDSEYHSIVIPRLFTRGLERNRAIPHLLWCRFGKEQVNANPRNLRCPRGSEPG
jgi:hypothetical protein